MSIATVVSISGQAWARDAEGNLRELQPGDQLLDGETLVTSDNGAVQLDFMDGLPPVAIGGGQQVAMSDELDADAPVEPDEASAQDEGIDALLAALDGEGDLLDDLEATAAGGGGGVEGGGHSFIQLARIVESVDPLAFAFDTERGNDVVNEGRSSQEFPTDGTDAFTATLDTSAEITVSLDDINSANVANALISGTTTGVEAGQVVTLVIRDANPDTDDVEVSAAVEADGSYTTTADLSSLDDGSLSVTATVSDQAGNAATATQTAGLDTEAPTLGNLAASVDVTISEAFLPYGSLGGKGPVASSSWFTISTGAADDLAMVSIVGGLSAGSADEVGEFVTVTLEQLKALSTASPVVIETDDGNTLRLTDFDVQTGRVSYEFELSGALAHRAGDISLDQLDLPGILVKAIDNAGNVTEDTINVRVVDDGPAINDPQHALLSANAGTSLSADFGAIIGADRLSASIKDVSLSSDADGFIQVTYFDPGLNEVKTSYLTAGSGNKLIYSVNDGVLTAKTVSGGVELDVFTIAFDVLSGRYEVEMLQGLDPVAAALIGMTPKTGGNTSNVVFANEAISSLEFLATGHGGTVNYSANTIWVGAGNKISTGERLQLDFRDPDMVNESRLLSYLQVEASDTSRWEAYLDGVKVGEGVGESSTLTTISIDDVGSYFDRVDFIGTSKGYSVSSFSGTFLDPNIDFMLDARVTVEDSDGDQASGDLDLTFSKDDTFVGSQDSDVIVAGSGSDQMMGGLGADVFAWQLGDEGQPGDPAHDTVKDFSLSEGDALDLAELLVDEQSGSIDDYLHAEPSASGDDTILHISTDGGFSGDYANNSGQEDQTITLEGVSMDNQSSDDFINNLINNGSLNIDQ